MNQIHLTPWLIVDAIIAIAGLSILWLMIILLMRKLSGWQKLSRFFECKADFSGGSVENIAISGSALGVMTCPCRLKLVEPRSLLMIRPIFIFGFFHRTLQIPIAEFQKSSILHQPENLEVKSDCGTRSIIFSFSEQFRQKITKKQEAEQGADGDAEEAV